MVHLATSSTAVVVASFEGNIAAPVKVQESCLVLLDQLHQIPAADPNSANRIVDIHDTGSEKAMAEIADFGVEKVEVPPGMKVVGQSARKVAAKFQERYSAPTVANIDPSLALKIPSRFAETVLVTEIVVVAAVERC